MKALIIYFSLALAFFQLSCGSEEDVLSSSPPALIPIDKSMKAFPTAEGHGAYAKGGRAGDVVYVTNLNDSGDGSLRKAIQTTGARTVIFAVSGIIELNSLLIIENPYITIAGQTAPGNGITLKNSGIYIKTHDVIIRHIRIRPGDADAGHKFEDRDALTIGQQSYNVMVDHVSASWSVDELLSTFYEPQFITFQYCIISEALSDSKHPEGEHSKGLLIGDNTQKISIHHNVFAHINDRAPVQVKGGSSCDVVNNIIYNWGQYAFSFAINYVASGVKINFLSNHFQKGSSTTGSFFAEPATTLDSKLYIKDNTGDDALLTDFNANRPNYLASKSYLVDAPVEWENNVIVHTMTLVRDSLLLNVGATLPQRDAVDTRIINDVKNNTGQIIDSPSEVGGYPNWTPVVLTSQQLNDLDADRDGIPNQWELDYGLNPNNYSDGKLDKDNDGYTNLEEYLNSL